VSSTFSEKKLDMTCVIYFSKKSRRKTCVILLFLKEAEIDTWQREEKEVQAMWHHLRQYGKGEVQDFCHL
jgi:hypothetical protein